MQGQLNAVTLSFHELENTTSGLDSPAVITIIQETTEIFTIITNNPIIELLRHITDNISCTNVCIVLEAALPLLLLK